MVLGELIPRLQGARTSVFSSLDRITQRSTDFIRGNPILSTALVGIGTSGLVVATAVIRRKVKKRKAKKKAKTTRKRTTKKRKKRRTHASPRHKGHKFVTFTTKDGKKVKFKVAKKGPKHKSHKRRKKRWQTL